MKVRRAPRCTRRSVRAPGKRAGLSLRDHQADTTDACWIQSVGPRKIPSPETWDKPEERQVHFAQDVRRGVKRGLMLYPVETPACPAG